MTTKTARFKDFGTGLDDADTPEPLSFRLHGESFDCVPSLQGKTLLTLAADANKEDGERNAEIVLEFFNHVLLDESLTRFNALISSKDRIVPVETLAAITTWLMGEYTNRPEKQPEA